MNLTIVRADDWVAAYIDENIYHQGHNIPTRVWLEILQLVSDAVVSEEIYADMDLMDTLGSFPDTLTACRDAGIIDN